MNKITNTVFNLPPGDFTYILNDKAHLTGALGEVSHKITHNADVITLYVIFY